jgi:hypothetical protein
VYVATNERSASELGLVKSAGYLSLNAGPETFSPLKSLIVDLQIMIGADVFISWGRNSSSKTLVLNARKATHSFNIPDSSVLSRSKAKTIAVVANMGPALTGHRVDGSVDHLVAGPELHVNGVVPASVRDSILKSISNHLDLILIILAMLLGLIIGCCFLFCFLGIFRNGVFKRRRFKDADYLSD